MSYSPYVQEVFPIFVYYIILIILSIIVTSMMVKKYLDRRTKATLYMSIIYITSTIVLFIITIGLAEAIITSYFKEIYRLSLPLGYTLLCFEGMFLLIFLGEMTDSSKTKKFTIPLIIIGIFVIILLFLPTNWWGVPRDDYEGKLNTRLIVTLLLVSYNILIYLIMARIYYQVMHKTKDPVAIFGFKLLLYSMICPIIFLVFVVLDTIFITFFNHPGYTIFMYFAWLFLMAFFILSYLALIMPKWVENRIKK